MVASRMTPLTTDEVRRLNRYDHHPAGKRMCSKCQEILELTDENFGIHRYYYDASGEVKSVGWEGRCRDCMVKKRAFHSAKIKEDPFWYCKKLTAQLRFRAKEQSVPFDICAEDLYATLERQGFTCKHTGAVLDFTLKGEGNYPHRDFPSVDRRIPKKGYVRDNIAWVTYSVNRMKNDLTEDEFISFCENISRRYSGGV